MCILDKNKDTFKLTISLNTIDKIKEFVKRAEKLDCPVTIADGDYVINGKSILAIFSLNLYDNLDVYVPFAYKRYLINMVSEWIKK